MIDFYGTSSPNVAKIAIMLEEVGETYETHLVDVFQAQQYDPEFMRIAPTAKVPAIIDRDAHGGPLPIFESGAILIYLAEKSGQLLSTDVRQRSAELQWLMVQVGWMGPMAGQAVHFTRFAPAGNDYGRERYYSQSAAAHRLFDNRLAVSGYLGGDQPSIADIAVFPWVEHAERFFDWLGGGSFAELHPNLARWRHAMHARPGVQRGLAAMETFNEVTKVTRPAASQETIDRFTLRGAYSAIPAQRVANA